MNTSFYKICIIFNQYFLVFHYFVYNKMLYLALILKHYTPVFLQDWNFWGSLMTPCLKIWETLTNLEGQFYEYIVISYGPLKNSYLLEQCWTETAPGLTIKLLKCLKCVHPLSLPSATHVLSIMLQSSRNSVHVLLSVGLWSIAFGSFAVSWE